MRANVCYLASVTFADIPRGPRHGRQRKPRETRRTATHRVPDGTSRFGRSGMCIFVRAMWHARHAGRKERASDDRRTSGGGGGINASGSGAADNGRHGAVPTTRTHTPLARAVEREGSGRIPWDLRQHATEIREGGAHSALRPATRRPRFPARNARWVSASARGRATVRGHRAKPLACANNRGRTPRQGATACRAIAERGAYRRGCGE